VIGHLLFITFFPLLHASTFLLPASILLRPAATAVSASSSSSSFFHARDARPRTPEPPCSIAPLSLPFSSAVRQSLRGTHPPPHIISALAPTAQVPFCRWLLLPTTCDAT